MATAIEPPTEESAMRAPIASPFGNLLLQGVLQISTLLAILAIIWQGGAKLGRIETQLEQQTKQVDQLSTRVDKQADDIVQLRIAFEQIKTEIQGLRADLRSSK